MISLLSATLDSKKELSLENNNFVNLRVCKLERPQKIVFNFIEEKFESFFLFLINDDQILTQKNSQESSFKSHLILNKNSWNYFKKNPLERIHLNPF